MNGTDRAELAILLSLAKSGIPADIQELLLIGNPECGIAPNALRKAIQATALSAEGGAENAQLANDPVNVLDYSDQFQFGFQAGRVFEAMTRGDLQIIRDVSPEVDEHIDTSADLFDYDVQKIELEDGLIAIRAIKKDQSTIQAPGEEGLREILAELAKIVRTSIQIDPSEYLARLLDRADTALRRLSPSPDLRTCNGDCDKIDKEPCAMFGNLQNQMRALQAQSANLIAAAKAEDCWQCSKPKGSFSNPYRTFATAKETAILSGAHVTVGKDLDALPDRLRQMGFFVCENQTTMADALLSMDLHEAATFIKRTALRSAGGE